ncbi:hypothetical protein ACFRCG_41750 [Embleya sp. NPDC056575]|uniref:hypothetical protein n=1 Tax=unclassified Embleya TaxID=2699296 RepID=UPI003693A1F1
MHLYLVTADMLAAAVPPQQQPPAAPGTATLNGTVAISAVAFAGLGAAVWYIWKHKKGHASHLFVAALFGVAAGGGTVIGNLFRQIIAAGINVAVTLSGSL